MWPHVAKWRRARVLGGEPPLDSGVTSCRRGGGLPHAGCVAEDMAPRSWTRQEGDPPWSLRRNQPGRRLDAATSGLQDFDSLDGRCSEHSLRWFVTVGPRSFHGGEAPPAPCPLGLKALHRRNQRGGGRPPGSWWSPGASGKQPSDVLPLSPLEGRWEGSFLEQNPGVCL